MTKNINFLISGYYGFNNFGDEAILAAIIKELKEKFEYPNITVLSKNPQETKSQHKVDAVQRFDIMEVLKGIKQTDIVISGGGSILQDVTSFRSLMYYLFIIFWAKVSKKKVFVYAQGIGPFYNLLSYIFTPMILKMADFITVRDQKSFEILENWNIPATITADPIWTNKSEQKPTKTVGVQLRKWQGIGGDFLNTLADDLNKHFKDYDVKFLSFQDSKDLKVLQRFRNILLKNTPGKKIEIVEYTGIENTIKEIEGLDYLIATRYHACLLGILANIPTVAINYDVKIESLSMEAGLPLIDIKDKDFDEAFENLINFEPELKENMKLVCIKNSTLASQNIELLSNLVNQ